MIELRHYRRGEIPDGLRQLLIDIHDEVYTALMDNPFEQRFPWFVDHWTGREGFSCVLGMDGEEPVGFAYGAPLEPGREWWKGRFDPGPGVTTFAVSELMVRDRWRKTGASEHLHSALLADRREDLAVLLVDVTHPKVRALYESWGYERVGEQQPFADSPIYAVMVKKLR